MPMATFGIFVLSATLVVQIFGRGFLPKFAKYVFILLAAAVLGAAVYDSIAQYKIWAGGGASKYLLPPYQNFGYFYFYAGTKFFSATLVAILAAIIIPRLAERLNKIYGERFFYNEEFGLMRLGIFLTGYPGFLIYLVFVLGAGVILSGAFAAMKKGRAPFYYFWMPLAISALVLAAFFSKTGLISQLLRLSAF